MTKTPGIIFPDTFQQSFRLQQQVKVLRCEIEKQKEVVGHLREKLRTYETLLVDKDGYINNIKQDIRKAEKNLKQEYLNYEKLIKKYKGAEERLTGELGLLRSVMFRRTCFTSLVIFLLLLISII